MQRKRPVVIVPRSAQDWRITDEAAVNRRPVRLLVRKSPPDASMAAPAVDRRLVFALAVRRRADGVLFRCEERYPHDRPNPVLYLVVERDAEQWREQVNLLYREHFGCDNSDPLAPVQLEVVDRATHDAVQRLITAGLIARTTRTSRSLWPPDESTTAPPPLSEAEREKAGSYRCQAARKLKMAGVLAGGDLREEARVALLDAIEPLGRALAVENHLPEPQSLEDALLPPLGTAWKEALPLVRDFLREASQPVPPILSVLGRI